ncbi:MAG: hypothetical protein ACI8QC_000986, partial [Planctomycetota bacterium]
AHLGPLQETLKESLKETPKATLDK